ncbi:MAG: DnaJ domain-containing protein [Candidatus Limnocylindrales bacterium]
MTAVFDPYKILQVDREAEDEVIVAAYRRLARKYHPDVASGAEAVARMAAINAAWEMIGEPARRAAFDRERAIRQAMERSGRAASTTPSTPTHEAATHAERSRRSPDGASRPQEPETVSRDWTMGRSTIGGGYDPSMRTADGEGAAGPPPGNASGSLLNFGRYAGWSLGEIARSDLEYIEWLDRMPIGRPYRDEIDGILRRAGRRRSAETEDTDRRGLFRRR